MTITNIPAGHLIHITTGEYSDYTIRGSFVSLKELSSEMLGAMAAVINQEKEEDDAYLLPEGHSMMIQRLIADGCLLEVHSRELWLGDGYYHLDLESK